jgi:hypothetical protein
MQKRLMARFSQLSLVLIGFLLFSSISKAEVIGTVTPTNSIIGGNMGDYAGEKGVVELPNGNIVIITPKWNGMVMAERSPA